jgi:hypothetical protein
MLAFNVVLINDIHQSAKILWAPKKTKGVKTDPRPKNELF